MSYDQAITIFSPNGHLFQVEYALEAVKKGLCSVGLIARGCVIMAVQKKAATKLQEPRTIRKILQIDQNLCMAFSGLNADARILANLTRSMVQSFRLDYDQRPSIQIVAKHIASTKQKYTQKGGVRPFGLSALLAGFDTDGNPHLFSTDPSGALVEWKANACGKSSKQVCQFFEKHYKDGISLEDGLALCYKALINVVESGGKNIEIGVLRPDGLRFLTEEQIEQLGKAVV